MKIKKKHTFQRNFPKYLIKTYEYVDKVIAMSYSKCVKYINKLGTIENDWGQVYVNKV